MMNLNFFHWKQIFTIAAGLVLALQSAMAQEVSWQTVSVAGEGKSALCAQDTLYTSYAGNSAALVFTNMIVELAPNAEHNSGAEFGGCRIVTKLVIPAGYYLAGLNQSTVAGVVKSVGARGEIRTRLDLKNAPGQSGSGLNGRIETRTRFAPEDEMNQPMLLLNGSFASSPSEIQSLCRTGRQNKTALNLEFRASVKGQRKTPGSAIIISIDSSDVQLDLNARLGRCP